MSPSSEGRPASYNTMGELSRGSRNVSMIVEFQDADSPKATGNIMECSLQLSPKMQDLVHSSALKVKGTTLSPHSRLWHPYPSLASHITRHTPHHAPHISSQTSHMAHKNSHQTPHTPTLDAP